MNTESAPKPAPTESPQPPKHRTRWWKKLLALLVSCLISFVLAEGVLRIAKPGFPGFRVPQTEHAPLAGVGFGMVPNQQAYTLSFPVTINSLGFRGPELKTGLQRVLCLGDSITFGYGVGDETPFPRQLEDRLNRDGAEFEVINAGVQRYFTYQEIDQLETYGLPLEPAYVVLCVYPNDLGIRPDAEDYVRQYDNEREQIASSFRKRFEWPYVFVKNIALVELFRITVLNRGSAGTTTRWIDGRMNKRDEDKWQVFRTEVERFHRLARENDFVPLVAMIPSRYQIARDAPNSEYPKRVQALCTELGIEHTDFVESFKQSLKSGTDPYLAWDNHLSPAGHQIVAEGIHKMLNRVR